MVNGRSLGAVAIGWALIAACESSFEPPAPPADTNPPIVQIFSISPGPVAVIGDLVLVDVRITDPGGISAIDAAVSGGVAFLFPTIAPNDTTFLGQFPIPTIDATPGTVTFAITAMDSASNAAADSISFTVRDTIAVRAIGSR